jgi:hypothetical protein
VNVAVRRQQYKPRWYYLPGFVAVAVGVAVHVVLGGNRNREVSDAASEGA